MNNSMNKPPEPVYTSYSPEVIADRSGVFTGNGLRFATADEAEQWAKALANRWHLVTKTRVVPTTDPVTARLAANGHSLPIQ